MHQTGIEDRFIIKDNKKLRYGYTTGSCAAAAAGSAALMLLTGRTLQTYLLRTPKGVALDLEIEDISADTESVSCAVRKDGGDDPDATHGILIYAKVSRTDEEGQIIIDGGTGVGRVTKPGLKQKIGEAAINPVPMKMIEDAVRDAAACAEYRGGLKVMISIPEGVRLAEKTFNPRLGIVGGISVLGTTGIVEPMSDAALIASIELEMSSRHATGSNYLLISPGNYGVDFVGENTPVDPDSVVQCSNFIGETLDMAVNMNITGLLFVGHIGKLIKVAGGIMNTHSHRSDCRAELMAAFALRAGASREKAVRILETITTEQALDILKEEGTAVFDKTMDLIAEKIKYYMQFHVGKAVQTEAVIFSSVHGLLAKTEKADELLELIGSQKKEGEKI